MDLSGHPDGTWKAEGGHDPRKSHEPRNWKGPRLGECFWQNCPADIIIFAQEKTHVQNLIVQLYSIKCVCVLYLVTNSMVLCYYSMRKLKLWFFEISEEL